LVEYADMKVLWFPRRGVTRASLVMRSEARALTSKVGRNFISPALRKASGPIRGGFLKEIGSGAKP